MPFKRRRHFYDYVQGESDVVSANTKTGFKETTEPDRDSRRHVSVIFSSG